MPVIRKLLSAVLLSTSLFIGGTLLAPICAADSAAAVSYDRAAPDAWAVNLPGEGTQYLFFHRMFASETYLFFCIEKESPNEFAVYCTEDFGKSFTRLSVDLSALTYSRAVPVYAGGGAGSGEGEFIVELRSADGSKYVSFNNYHYTDSSNWLDFRCTGEVDGTYLADLRTYYPEQFHDQPEIPLYGQPYTPSATVEKLEADGWECTRTRTFTDILGFSGEMRTYSRNGESRTVLVDGISGKTIFVTDRSIQSADIDGDGRREIRTTESRTDADGYSVYDDRLFMSGEDGIYVYGISKTMRAYIPNAHYQRLCMTNEGAMRIEYTLYSDEYRYETVSHHVRWTEEGLRILETRIRRYDLLAPVDSDSPEWSAEYDPVSNTLCLNCTDGRSYFYEIAGQTDAPFIVFNVWEDLRMGRKLRISPDGRYGVLIAPAATFTVEDAPLEHAAVVDLQSGEVVMRDTIDAETLFQAYGIEQEGGLFGYNPIFEEIDYTTTLEAEFTGEGAILLTGTLKMDDGSMELEDTKNVVLP